jgi:hypothetical protein
MHFAEKQTQANGICPIADCPLFDYKNLQSGGKNTHDSGKNILFAQEKKAIV